MFRKVNYKLGQLFHRNKRQDEIQPFEYPQAYFAATSPSMFTVKPNQYELEPSYNDIPNFSSYRSANSGNIYGSGHNVGSSTSDISTAPSQWVQENAYLEILIEGLKENQRRVRKKPLPTPPATQVIIPDPRPSQPSEWEEYDEDVWWEARSTTLQIEEARPPVRECNVCMDEKHPGLFPEGAPTQACEHASDTCLECLNQHIMSAMSEIPVLHDDSIQCPECDKPLSKANIQAYADPETFAKYAERADNTTIDLLPNLFRCLDARCGSAQIHGSGPDEPIVVCAGCGGKFCFVHRVSWHGTLTCAEYEQFLADPSGFRSRLERDNEMVEREHQAVVRQKREQEERDRAFAQGLLDQEQKAEAERQAEAERKEMAERERKEALRRAEEQRKALEARRKMEADAARKVKEEAENMETIRKTTKPCPKCKAPIEKNKGCDHMKCIKCKHDFCWECNAPYKSIRATDNTAHERTCKYHSDNVK